MRFANDDEINSWNEHILNNPDRGNVFSSLEFARQKETGGYKARFVIASEPTLAITVLEKSTPPLGKFWYLPKGPGVLNIKDLDKTMHSLGELAREHSVFAIRIEPELAKNLSAELVDKGYKKARPIIPNPSTIHLDLSPPIETILACINQKARHAINRAKRDGVSVEAVASNPKNCKIMYQLLKETAEGQFGIRNYQYFESFWQRFEQANIGQMFFAYYQGQVVSAAYALKFGTKSTYKDGASIRSKTVYGASHLLQWTLVEWAKNHGCLVHDLCGSPPSDQIENVDHPHYGVGRFKLSFSRNVLDFIGCYDYVISPAKYRVWTKVGERIAHRIHYYKNHDSYF